MNARTRYVCEGISRKRYYVICNSDMIQLRSQLHDAEQRSWEYSLLLKIAQRTLEDVERERDTLQQERDMMFANQTQLMQQMEMYTRLAQQQQQQQEQEQEVMIPETAIAATNTTPIKFCVSPSSAARRVMDESAALRFANEVLIQKVLCYPDHEWLSNLFIE